MELAKTNGGHLVNPPRRALHYHVYLNPPLLVHDFTNAVSRFSNSFEKMYAKTFSEAFDR